MCIRDRGSASCTQCPAGLSDSPNPRRSAAITRSPCLPSRSNAWRKPYAEAPQPCSISTGSPFAGPPSTRRTRSPLRSAMIRAEISRLRAGKISFAESERGTTSSLDRIDRPSHQPRDEAEAESHVGPALVAGHVVLERIHRPDERARASRRRQPFVGMPDTFRIAVVEKTIEELAPVVVLPQKADPGHQLEPGDGKGNVLVGDVAIRQQIA